jgi:hypothetical protein
MSEQLSFDLEAGRAGRDEGIARIIASNPSWTQQGLAFIAGQIAPGWQGIGEDIRFLAQPIIGPPTKPKYAWGALCRAAATRGYLVKTGRHLPMQDISSHGRESPEWRRTTYYGGGTLA